MMTLRAQSDRSQAFDRLVTLSYKICKDGYRTEFHHPTKIDLFNRDKTMQSTLFIEKSPTDHRPVDVNS